MIHHGVSCSLRLRFRFIKAKQRIDRNLPGVMQLVQQRGTLLAVAIQQHTVEPPLFEKKTSIVTGKRIETGDGRGFTDITRAEQRDPAHLKTRAGGFTVEISLRTSRQLGGQHRRLRQARRNQAKGFSADFTAFADRINPGLGGA